MKNRVKHRSTGKIGTVFGNYRGNHDIKEVLMDYDNKIHIVSTHDLIKIKK